MALWLQHLLVITAVMAAAAFIARGAFRALAGKKSGLSACGSCSSCATSPKAQAEPSATRVVFLPADALIKRR